MATQEQRTSIVWDYAPAPESPEHVRLRDSYGLFVNGEFVDPVDGTRVPSINPATEGVVAEVAFAGAQDIARAVQAARAASTARRTSAGPAKATSATTSSVAGLIDGTRVPSTGSTNSPPMNSPYESRSRTWSGDSGAGA